MIVIKNKIKTVCTISFITLILFGFIDNKKSNNIKKSENKDSTIIGTWVSQEDSQWKLNFKSDSTCISIYAGSVSDTSIYSISNSSPQCDILVPVNNFTNYLKLQNISNVLDKNCYLINGITDTHLSLSLVDSGGVLVFVKQ